MINKSLFIIDIQLFAEEKTEKATPKRKKDVRERGQVVKSVEINSALIVLSSFFALMIFGEYIYKGIKGIFDLYISIGSSVEGFYTKSNIHNISIDLIVRMLLICAPLFLIILFTGLIVNYLQVGFLYTTKAITPKISKINPIEGFKRIFSIKGVVELLKSMLKIIVIGSIAYNIMSKKVGDLPLLITMDIYSVVIHFGGVIIDIAIKSGLALIGLGIFDYVFNWWEHQKNIRMTKQEVKDEYKQMEGDPKVRAKIREKQRKISMRRMMQSIPKADVVITNPTHYAVAIKYDQDEGDAPVVLAKGEGFIALKIKEIAKKENVQIIENKVVAQALYKTTEIGQEIPPELYQAVAEILAYIYRMDKRR
jgi:flagellar biosynthetic protein FlhB